MPAEVEMPELFFRCFFPVFSGPTRFSQPFLRYGDLAPIQTQGQGLVLFWSLKNPTYPERVLRTSSAFQFLDSEQAETAAAGSRKKTSFRFTLVFFHEKQTKCKTGEISSSRKRFISDFFLVQPRTDPPNCIASFIIRSTKQYL